ncbi:hypothetical protein BDV38DRAFT_267658 [Aspergillus pseudotamarii]|uniref:Uncharacterized protein n=1 Tax=Aspergillus pseudotamarii TaxID=132259 RepID=A0A5N6T9Q1_ASPPS|nr:uncharacterized protein BDV38DRAFT_267658 [Aspergillus pseudotamarii]KAE8143075.1 hypothetical protein BDV38DRAFT_267658 [Aspergillus pseudotamarii]
MPSMRNGKRAPEVELRWKQGWLMNLSRISNGQGRFFMTGLTCSSGARTKSNVYYKNAIAAVPELLLRKPDLMAVQALMGIFEIHGPCATPRSTGREKEQPILTLSLGLPPSNASADLGADSPHPDWVYESIAQNAGPSDMDLFTWFRRLSVIRHKIYTSLYRTKDSQAFPHGQSSIVQALQLELTSFQRTLPVDLGHAVEFITRLPGHPKSPFVSLLCAYHNTVILLHQTQIFFRAPKVSTPSRATELSQKACVGAARQTAFLLNALPPWWWPLVTLYIFAAFNILFASQSRVNGSNDLPPFYMCHRKWPVRKPEFGRRIRPIGDVTFDWKYI